MNPILSADYFKEGEGPLPEVQWNGNQGKFGLENTVQGLSLEVDTGQFKWDSSLPLGVHTVTLFAYNSAGKDQVATTINNQFQGTFKGTYQPAVAQANIVSHNMEIVFETNGTFSGFRQKEMDDSTFSEPSYFEGNYTRVENKLQGTMSLANGQNNVSFQADLDQSGQLPQLSGSYTQSSEEIPNLNLTTLFELEILIEP